MRTFNRAELIKARDAIRALPSLIRMSEVADIIDYCLHHFDGAGEYGRSYNNALDQVKLLIEQQSAYEEKECEEHLRGARIHEAARCAIAQETYTRLLYDIERMRI